MMDNISKGHFIHQCERQFKKGFCEYELSEHVSTIYDYDGDKYFFPGYDNMTIYNPDIHTPNSDEGKKMLGVSMSLRTRHSLGHLDYNNKTYSCSRNRRNAKRYSRRMGKHMSDDILKMEILCVLSNADNVAGVEDIHLLNQNIGYNKTTLMYPDTCYDMISSYENGHINIIPFNSDFSNRKFVKMFEIEPNVGFVFQRESIGLVIGSVEGEFDPFDTMTAYLRCGAGILDSKGVFKIKMVK